jgi:hypothetical protein
MYSTLCIMLKRRYADATISFAKTRKEGGT